MGQHSTYGLGYSIVGVVTALMLALAIVTACTPDMWPDVRAAQSSWVSWDEDGRGTLFVTPDVLFRRYDEKLPIRDTRWPWSVEYQLTPHASDQTQYFWNGVLLDAAAASEAGVLDGLLPARYAWPQCPVAYRYDFVFDGGSLVVERVEAKDYLMVGEEFDPGGIGSWLGGGMMGVAPLPSGPVTLSPSPSEIETHATWAAERFALRPDEPFFIGEDGRGYVVAVEAWRTTSRYDPVGSPPGGWLQLVGPGSLDGLEFDVAVKAWVSDTSVALVDGRIVNLIDHLDRQERVANTRVSSDVFRPGAQILGLLVESSGQLVFPAIMISDPAADSVVD